MGISKGEGFGILALSWSPVHSRISLTITAESLCSFEICLQYLLAVSCSVRHLLFYVESVSLF